MQIKSFSFENIGIVPKATITFGQRKPGYGQLIKISGPNGSGKSTILNAVKVLFWKGHDPGVLSHGKEEGSIRAELSDGVKYWRTVTQKGYYLHGESADGLKFDPPESEMKRLAEGFGLDPLAFDAAWFTRDGKKKQLEFFLKHCCTAVFTNVEILKAMGPAEKILIPPVGDQDINGINKLLKDLEERRASIGNLRDEKSNSANRLRITLPPDDAERDPKNWGAELGRLDRELSALDKSERDEIARINRLLKESTDTNSKAIRTAEELLSKEYQRLLDICRNATDEPIEIEQIETQFGAVWALYNAQRAEDASASTAIQALKDQNATKRQALSAYKATAQANNDTQQRVAGVRDSMNTFAREAQELSAKYDQTDAAIKAIEKLKKSKLKDMPIQDVDVKDGELYLDGLEWGQVNRARRYLKSIEIGCRALGDIDFIVADEFEHLDADAKEDFKYAVETYGITALVAEVFSGVKCAECGHEWNGQSSDNCPVCKSAEKEQVGLRSEPAGALVMA